MGLRTHPFILWRESLVELLPLPCGYIVACLCMCVNSRLCLLSVCGEQVLSKGFILNTTPGLLFLRLYRLQSSCHIGAAEFNNLATLSLFLEDSLCTSVLKWLRWRRLVQTGAESGACRKLVTTGSMVCVLAENILVGCVNKEILFCLQLLLRCPVAPPPSYSTDKASNWQLWTGVFLGICQVLIFSVFIENQDNIQHVISSQY